MSKEEVKENKNLVNPLVPQAFLDAMQKQAREAATKAADDSFVYAKQISDQMLLMVGEEVNKLSTKIKTEFSELPTLAVKINDKPVKKLKSTAPKYLDRMIVNAKLGLNSLLVGPMGCGKTTAASMLAESLELDFGHLNLTAGASETWLFGRQTPNGFIEGVFSKMYKAGGVFLADELDAADPNLLLSINTAIAGSSMYNPISGELIKRHNDFIFVGAANTFGKGGDHVYTGRNRLDAATLDRFTVIKVDYDPVIEKQVCPDKGLLKTFNEVRKMLAAVNSPEGISTRGIVAAYKQINQGLDKKEILHSITDSWSKVLRDKANVLFDKYVSEAKVETEGEKKWEF